MLFRSKGGRAGGLDSKVSVLGYFLVVLTVLFFSFLAITEPWIYWGLSAEDYPVETFTSVLFFAAGLLLFVTARVERSFFRRWIYILGGVALVFVAGEEISWGQRIFGFPTPDFLMDLNAQDEVNVHNINVKLFTRIYQDGTLILCMVTCAAFFCRKDTLFGIPLPSILLMLSCLVMLSYAPIYTKNEILRILSLVYTEKGLLLLFIIFTLLSGQAKLFIAGAATLALVVSCSSANYHSQVFYIFEVREYLLSIICFFYSLELLLAQGQTPLLSGIKRWSGSPPTTRLNSPDLDSVSVSGFLPGLRWLTVCSLIIACCIGLAVLEYFSTRAKISAAEETYQSIMFSEPVIRSNFDVYLVENQLIYFKEPCAPGDTKSPFWLHVVPAAATDLSIRHGRYSFDNLKFALNSGRHRFAFGWYGAHFDGKCLATIPLPGYDFASIRTAQHTGIHTSETEIWREEFARPSSGRPPHPDSPIP